MKELFEVTADYPFQDSEFADSEYKARQNGSIRVMADAHRQHIWTHTKLVGVSKAGVKRLTAFCKLHKDAEIRLAVPNGPLLDGWETDDYSR